MWIYKVVEVPVVTDEHLSEAINKTVALGWQFEAMHFVMRDGSRRPVLAFLTFIREGDPLAHAEGAAVERERHSS